MKVAELIQNTRLTDSQISWKIHVAVRQWLEQNGYKNKVRFQYTRGIYYLDNCIVYHLHATALLESITGLKFEARGEQAAKLVSQF